MMTPRGSGRKFQPPSVNAKQQAKEAKEGGKSFFDLPEGLDVMTIDKEGMYRFDIIPYIVTKARGAIKAGTLHYERTYFAHFSVGVDNRAFICPRMFGKKCPICEEFDSLRKDPNVDWDSIKGLRPKERQLFLVVDLKNKEKGVQALDLAKFNFGKGLIDRINETEIDEDAVDYSVFANLEDGLTIRAHFVSSSIKTKDGSYNFLKCEKPDFIPRKEQYDESILDDLPKLDDILRLSSYEKIAAAFFGAGEEEPVTEEAAEEAPAPAAKAPVARPAVAKAAPKPAPAPEPEEPVEEEETPAPPPKRPVGRPLVKKAPVVEEEPEETSEEEEAPAPPPKKAVGKPIAKAAEGECPSGYEWGADAGCHDECDTCPVFDPCNRAGLGA